MANFRKGKKDQRGSAEDRARRKTWIMFFYGNGVTVQCVHCDQELQRHQVEQDRIIPGGPYNRKNVQPSCSECNRRRGNSPITPYRVAS